MSADTMPRYAPARGVVPRSAPAARTADRLEPGGVVPIDSGPTLEAFVQAHLGALVRYGTALTGNAHDGADLAQTACEKAALHWSRVSRTADPLVYVKAIMANARISTWRRRRRESLLAELPERSATDTYPVEHAELWSAVAALPRRQKAVIVLRYLEGHSEAEIAEALGVTKGTVKSQASKAMTHLRAALGEQTWESLR